MKAILSGPRRFWGYPNGKRAEATPLAARIVMICDIYDALRSRRPYKSGVDHAKSVEIMTRGDGRTQPEHFDPALLAAFKENHTAFRDIFEAYTGEAASRWKEASGPETTLPRTRD